MAPHAGVSPRARRAALHQRRGGAHGAPERRAGAAGHRGARLLRRRRHHGTTELQVCKPILLNVPLVLLKVASSEPRFWPYSCVMGTLLSQRYTPCATEPPRNISFRFVQQQMQTCLHVACRGEHVAVCTMEKANVAINRCGTATRSTTYELCSHTKNLHDARFVASARTT